MIDGDSAVTGLGSQAVSEGKEGARESLEDAGSGGEHSLRLWL